MNTIRATPVRRALVMVILAGGTTMASARLSAQIPDTFTNLRHLPADISRDSLIGIMRQFSFALGARCQYCHAGGDGVSFEGVEFDSDEKPTKRKARYMLGMVDDINNELLADLPDRSTPNVRIECRTCHRGMHRPRMIEDLLKERIAESGSAAAVTYYDSLRAENYGLWSYDFGEWPINDLASELAGADDTRSAVALMEMNSRYYPESFSVWQMLGDFRRTAGDRTGAIESYQKALEIAPGHPGIQQRLRDLGGGP